MAIRSFPAPAGDSSGSTLVADANTNTNTNGSTRGTGADSSLTTPMSKPNGIHASLSPNAFGTGSGSRPARRGHGEVGETASGMRSPAYEAVVSPEGGRERARASTGEADMDVEQDGDGYEGEEDALDEDDGRENGMGDSSSDTKTDTGAEDDDDDDDEYDDEESYGHGDGLADGMRGHVGGEEDEGEEGEEEVVGLFTDDDEEQGDEDYASGSGSCGSQSQGQSHPRRLKKPRAPARSILHIEARLPALPSRLPYSDAVLRTYLRTHLQSDWPRLTPSTVLDVDAGAHRALRAMERVWVAECDVPRTPVFDRGAAGLGEGGEERLSSGTTNAMSVTPPRHVRVQDVDLRLHLYRMAQDDEVRLIEGAAGDDDGQDESAAPAATVRDLPALVLEGLWDSLIYPENIKSRLLDYISSTLMFSRAGVDTNIISCNRLILLHGPPGTGKTSLSRALAQKLSIRLASRYPFGGRLVEISAHSLFSKWFSESGKLVQKLFEQVTVLVQEKRGFVVVMVDEVESLSASRTNMGSAEPGDSVRAVNALLTQLDKLKAYPNVVIVATSNIADSIDSAFIDRADIKQYVPRPPPEAVYWILRGSLLELMRVGMMRRQLVPEWRDLDSHVPPAIAQVGPRALSNGAGRPKVAGELAKQGKRKRGEKEQEVGAQVGDYLKDIAFKCHHAELSGRFLRRLLALAHAEFIAPTQGGAADGEGEDEDGEGQAVQPRSMGRWLVAIDMMVQREIVNKAEVGRKTDMGMSE